MRSTELKKRYKDEKVYVIPNKYLFKVPNGFTDISKYNKKQINNFMSIFENKGFLFLDMMLNIMMLCNKSYLILLF